MQLNNATRTLGNVSVVDATHSGMQISAQQDSIKQSVSHAIIRWAFCLVACKSHNHFFSLKLPRLAQHIYFLNMNPETALLYLCQVSRVVYINDNDMLHYVLLQGASIGYHYPNYLWIVPGWYSDNWWREFPDYLTTLNCTLTQVEQVLNRSLTFLPVPGNINSTTAGDITTLLNPSSYAADAVRALALALNESLTISSCSANLGTCALTSNLTTLSFNGTSVSCCSVIQVALYSKL